MARLIVVATKNIRDKRKMIRGTLAEQADSELGGALDPTPVEPVPIVPDRAGRRWQRPVISAPIPTMSNERYAIWGVWDEAVPADAESLLRALAQADPDIRFFKQQAAETLTAFRTRWRNGLNWIDQP